MTTIQIFFNDLKPEKQEELLAAVGASEPNEMNWDMDIAPLAIIDFDEMED